MAEEAVQQEIPAVPPPVEQSVARPKVPAVEETTITNGETQNSEPKEEVSAAEPVPAPAVPAVPAVESMIVCFILFFLLTC